MGGLLDGKQERVWFLDYLRLLATLAVIVIHVSAQNLDAVPVGSYPWQVFTAANQAVSWAVPMFLMLTGALFLDDRKPLDLKKLYRGNILRIVTAFFFWSAVYAGDQYLQTRDLPGAVQAFFQGSYHMWYLCMLVAYYIVVPVFRKLTESKTVTEYFLRIVFVYMFAVPCVVVLVDYLKLPHTATLIGAVNYWYGTANFVFNKYFVFYFVFGFYLFRYDLSPRQCRTVYGLGIAGYAAKLLLLNWHGVRTGSGANPFDFGLFDLAMAAALFLFAKQILSRVRLTWRGERILSTLSKATFGVYLSHVLVISKLRDWLGLTTLSFGPVWSLLLVTAAVAAVSLGISLAVHQIPVLKKYVV